jgi:hypothetical protein
MQGLCLDDIQPLADDMQGLRLDVMQPLADDMQGLCLAGLMERGDISGEEKGF